MDYAYQIGTYGPPSALVRVALERPHPGSGEVLIRQTAIGFNFTDINHRSGRYPVPLPSILGVEAAGVVEAIGPEVRNFKVGQRVIYTMCLGAYASARTIDAEKLVPIPDDIDDETAIAAFMKALTAEFLVKRLRPLRENDTVLLHAAAGGVGAMVTQWATHLGANVIGVVGNESKVDAAVANGCRAVHVGLDNLADKVRATAPAGVDVVYDSVGPDTLEASLRSLRRRGLYVSFGSASGMLPAFDLNELPALGAPFLTRAAFSNYYESRSDLLEGAAAVFDLVRQGVLRPKIGARYALDEVSACHHDAEARRHTGSVVLIPNAAHASSGAA